MKQEASISQIRRSRPLAGRTILAVLAAAGALYAGCSDSPTEPARTSIPAALAPVSPTSITGTVGAAVTDLPSVQVTDQFGEPMFGVQVTFSVAGGSGTVTGNMVHTNAQGVATLGSWMLGTTAGTQGVSATAAGLSPVSFTATALPDEAVSLAKSAGDGQSAAVGTVVAIPPTVVARDKFDNPVPGVAVVFAVTGGGGSVTGATATTDATGSASVGSWTLGTVPGENTLTATADTMTVTFTATATAGAAATMAIQAGDAQTATAGTSVAVAPSVRITDAFGNPVHDAAVTFAVGAGGGSVTGGAQLTDEDGIATVDSWTLGTAAGGNTLTASSGELSVTFSATGVAGPAALIVKQAGDEQEAIVGTAVAVEPSVLVTDVHGNPVAGETVTFSVESGGGSVTGASQVTDAAGLATVGSWTLGMTAGENTLTAGAGPATATFTATGTPAPPADIEKLAGDAQDATVGTAVPIAPSVRVTDLHGNPVPDATVTFSVTGGGGSVTGGSQVTDADGIATVGSWTLGTTAGANSLTASVNGLSEVFTATGEPDAPALVAIQAGDEQEAPVDTEVPIDPAVLVTDTHGNPVPGVQVTFAPALGGGSVTGAQPLTNASGIAVVGSWTLGTVTGTNTLTATVVGLTPVTFTANAIAGPPADIDIVAGDEQTATVGTAVTTAPSVKVTDAFGNDVPGASVTFAVESGDGLVGGAVQNTDSEGVATVGSWTLGTTAGTNTLSATVNGHSVLFTATGIAGPPAELVIVTGDGQTATVNTAVSVPLTVRVEDQHGNPVEGATVTFRVGSGGGSITDSVHVTLADGLATLGSWTLGTTAGENTVIAEAGGIETTFTATGTPGDPDAMTVFAGDEQTAQVNTVVPTAPAVLITDEFGNPVPDITVNFAVTGGGGIALGTSPATNAAGTATVGSWRLGTAAGVNNLEATSGVLVAVVFSASGTPGPMTSVGVLSALDQTAPAGSEVPELPSIQARDFFNNPVPGVPVTFAITVGTGTISGEQLETGSDGIATLGSWILGPGANTVTATVGSFVIAFTATGTP